MTSCPANIISLVFFLVQSAAAGPRLALGQSSWDFGTVTNQIEITHDFIIQNVGDAPLEITRVASSCESCLQVALVQRKIPAGGKVLLHARLDLHTLAGPIYRFISLDCNDPKMPSAALNVTGIVDRCYQVAPAELVLDLSQGQGTGTAEIISLARLRAPLSRVICENTNLLAQLFSPASNHFILAVQTLPTFPTGRTNLSLKLMSPDPADPACLIRIIVYHPAELEILPAELNWRAQDEPQQRILWLKQPGLAPAILLDAIAPSDKFYCEIDPDPLTHGYRIYVTARQLAGDAGRTNQLVLKTRNSRREDQSLTVQMLVDKN